MKIALFTLESLSSSSALHRFIETTGHDIVLLALSDPYRPSAGGMLGQTLKHWRRSGWRFLPYLAVNFSFPELAWGIRRTTLRHAARRHGIPTATIRDTNSQATLDLLRQSGAELIVSYHFDQIFTAPTLAAVARGGINVHPSLLPRHRGPVPTLYALMETPRATGVSVHRLAPQIDAGALLAQANIDLPADATVISASTMLHEAAVPMVENVITQLESQGSVDGTPAALLPYCPFPSPQQLRDAARRGVRLSNWRDLHHALLG